MRDLIASGVKTAIQAGVVTFVAWLLGLGIELDPAAIVSLETGLFLVAMGVVTFALNWLGKKFPVVNSIVSLTLTRNTVSYQDAA